MKRAKYYKINYPFGDNGVSPIEDDEELAEWLKDGSLELGDIIIQAAELFEVEVETVRNKSLKILPPEADA